MQISDFFDNAGNLHVGSCSRATAARITVDPRASDAVNVALDVAAARVGGSNRAVVVLGDYTMGQDTAQSGAKNFGVLNASGALVAALADANGNSSFKAAAYNINIPLIVAPTGSMANNGVLTSGTANPLTYLKSYTWLPTAAIFAASPAGWYWTVWTTTTAAIVYQETWDGVSAPVAVATPTAWVKTGPGAFTGPTTEALYFALPLPASTVNTYTDIEFKTAQTNNANAKSVSVRMTNLAGTVLAATTQTSLAETDSKVEICGQGVVNKQRVSGWVVGATAVARVTNALTSEVQNVPFSIAFTVSKGTATDVLVIEGILISQIG